MDSDIRKRLAAARKQLNPATPDERSSTDDKHRPRRHRRRLPLIIAICIGSVLIALVLVVVIMRKDPHGGISILPPSVTRSVPFPVYYPDPKKLPQGYTLDQASFSATNQAVVYSVVYDTDKRIAFTVQSKPADSDLQTFYSNHIPLRNEFQTSAGTAAVSSLNGQTFASLPTHDNAWLIITAPNDVDLEAFKTLLSAVRRD